MKKRISYESAGVNIDAGNEAVDRIKKSIKTTFSTEVLKGIGGFGSLYDLKKLSGDYKNPVLVQSIDGVGTKTIIARKMKKFDTIGIDLLSACANDIIVMGARPLTFLDYIANDQLNPQIIEEIVSGMVTACCETGVSLVGGETAEMPGTYLPGEHDLVGVITGVVDKEKIITGNTICPGDKVLGLKSNGLHTNGYSLARKIFFDIGKYEVNEIVPGLDRPIGDCLLEPHINYTNVIFSILEKNIELKGLAHITGGGLVENIPRILPNNCAVNIQEGSWPSLPLFEAIRSIGNIPKKEMFRVFNMGIGMVLFADAKSSSSIKNMLAESHEVFEIGNVISGPRKVYFSL
tara:strand:- start:27413 stop:28456 length:1044 start_codon:yes stop_codon:yes gene_type:complete